MNKISRLYDVLEQIIEKVNKSVKFDESQILTEEERQIVLTNLGLDNSPSMPVKINIEPEDNDIPKVFIDGVIPSTKDEVLAELTYISKTLSFHSYIAIKCQGTSSMSYPKKNFTIKLFKDEDRSEKMKVNFKGWGKQNKFCLKANWIDISHLRNVVSARIWGDIVKSRSNYEEYPEEFKTSPNQGAVDGTITVARCYNENGQIHKNEKVMEYVAVSEALRLGCYRSNSGGTGRFAKGILNDCKIYNYAISDEEMNELLLSTTVLS